jgi:hypothetical protein
MDHEDDNVTPIRKRHPKAPNHDKVFQKGRAKTGGRKPGVENKTPKLLRECIVMAAELEGSNEHGKDKMVGFLRKVAREDLRGFVMLLGRVLPLQFESRQDLKVEVVYHTIAEVRRELQSRGISVETVTRILHQPPQTVEHDGIEMIDDEDIVDVKMEEQPSGAA